MFDLKLKMPYYKIYDYNVLEDNVKIDIEQTQEFFTLLETALPIYCINHKSKEILFPYIDSDKDMIFILPTWLRDKQVSTNVLDTQKYNTFLSFCEIVEKKYNFLFSLCKNNKEEQEKLKVMLTNSNAVKRTYNLSITGLKCFLRSLSSTISSDILPEDLNNIFHILLTYIDNKKKGE